MLKRLALLLIMSIIFTSVFFAGAGSVYAAQTNLYNVSLGATTTYSNSYGDTWLNTWADDGNVYSLSCDTSGFNAGVSRNIMINKLVGSDPKSLTATTINTMDDYLSINTGEPDDSKGSWKATGIICVNGVLYAAINRQAQVSVGTTCPNQDSSIIKSTDHGLTWTRSKATNKSNPMWPGQVFFPSFIQYGQNDAASVDGADNYVYAVSNDGYWYAGNDIILGRVLKSDLSNNTFDATKWQFYKHVTDNGTDAANWVSDITQATHQVDIWHKCGSGVSVQYVSQLQTYVMADWYYHPDSIGKSDVCYWDMYQAPHPWGPWTRFAATASMQPYGYYNPGICGKFTSADGKTLQTFVSGDFMASGQPNYKFVVQPITLSTTPIPDGTNLLQNTSFDADIGSTYWSSAVQNPAFWTTYWSSPSNYDADQLQLQSGSDYALLHWKAAPYDVYTFQTVTNLSNGTYTLKAKVRSSGGQSSAYVEATNYGGSTIKYNINSVINNWTDIEIDNISVTNGQCQIGVYSNDTIGGKWILVDDINLFKSSTTPTTVNDSVTGTGNNQFQYVGTWYSDANRPSAYNSDEHYSQTNNDYVQLAFYGTQVKYYSSMANDMGKAGISIDGGTETVVDFYSSSQTWQNLMYTSPTLSVGNHTLKIRLNGQKNGSSSGYWVCTDKVVVVP